MQGAWRLSKESNFWGLLASCILSVVRCTRDNTVTKTYPTQNAASSIIWQDRLSPTKSVRHQSIHVTGYTGRSLRLTSPSGPIRVLFWPEDRGQSCRWIVVFHLAFTVYVSPSSESCRNVKTAKSAYNKTDKIPYKKNVPLPWRKRMN